MDSKKDWDLASHINGFENKYSEERPFKSHSWQQDVQIVPCVILVALLVNLLLD